MTFMEALQNTFVLTITEIEGKGISMTEKYIVLREDIPQTSAGAHLVNMHCRDDLEVMDAEGFATDKSGSRVLPILFALVRDSFPEYPLLPYSQGLA